MTPSDTPDRATLALLASAFVAIHATDDPARRGADNALRHLGASPVRQFDAAELRVLSEDRAHAADGREHVADYLGCSCPSGGRPWCKHRIAYRLLLAELALRDPAALVRQLLEQVAPADVGADAFDVAAVGAAAGAIGQIVETPFDLTDDALYADLVAGVPLAPARPRAEIAMDELYPPR